MKYYNKIRVFGLLCLLALVWGGCTDWDDHYDEEGLNVVADKTLWEEIDSRDELADFKKCLEKHGYKERLNGSQMYTVFAPEGKIDTVGLSEEKIRTEVIENHIARFAHSANAAVNGKPAVVMLNNKAINFMQSGENYRFGEKMFTKEYNIRAKNGVLHIIEGQQPFFHNIWEYLTTNAQFDSIRTYLYSFNDTILDEDKSVKGEINEDGQQEYLDSVVYIYNPLLSYIGELNNEDSTYTMILPTNDAWNDAYKDIKDYYKYPTNLYSQYPSRVASKKRDSLSNYYTKLSIVRNLVFSHAMQLSVEDSLVSTTGSIFKNPFGYILSSYSGWSQAEECSNGGIFIVDTLRHKPWDSWHKPIKLEAEQANALDNLKTTGASIYRRTLPNTDTLYTKVSNGSYLEVTPSLAASKPVITFNVWNTLAGEYNVKVVFLPQAYRTSKGTSRPNLFDVKYESLNNKGELASKSLSLDLVTNPMKLDTVDVGPVKLMRCAYGTEMVGLKLVLESYSNDPDGKEQSTTYLIDCIILEPSKK